MGGQTKVREWPKYLEDVVGQNCKVIPHLFEKGDS
ncbi:MAG: hypothetical protein HEEMFOPI_01769 [Holosporales bacterium]